MKKKNQCIELIKMFFYQYIYKCTSAKICYKMEKNEIYDVYKINNIYAKKSTITIVQ